MKEVLQKLFNHSTKQSIAFIIIGATLNTVALIREVNMYFACFCYTFAFYAFVLFIVLVVNNFKQFANYKYLYYALGNARIHDI